MHDTMNIPTTKSLRKDLRNNGTSAEATLWSLIKGKQIDGVKFRRQHSVGPYILDFYCPQLRLCIELDGEVHSTSEAMDYADNRARFLINEKDIWVIRFENRVVFENPSLIVDDVREVARKRRGNPTTSPYGYSSFQKEESGDTTDSSVSLNGNITDSSVSLNGNITDSSVGLNGNATDSSVGLNDDTTDKSATTSMKIYEDSIINNQ